MKPSILMCMVWVAGCGSVKGEMAVDAAEATDATIDSPTACTASTTSCAGDDLIVCDDQGVVAEMTPCQLGCDSSAGRCRKVDPSNGLAAALDEAEQGVDFALVGNATIDTDTGIITDQSGPRTAPTETLTAGLPIPVFVIKARSVTLNQLVVSGTRALAIVSHGPIQVNGHLSIAARSAESGPGAITTSAGCRGGTGTSNTEGKPGGGGGGFGTAGGNGGSGGSPTIAGPSGGAMAGNVELVPLRGGCPGGHSGGNGPSSADQPDPGGAGGAIQLVSNTSITLAVEASIDASGAGGKAQVLAVACPANVPCGFGEGGGAGGGVLLEAPTIDVMPRSGVYANGGGGSCSLTGGGQPGQRSTRVAQGQVCSGINGTGGDGSTGLVLATNGTNRSGLDTSGGGGGGGAGRIRVNLPAGVAFTPSGTFSPPPTTGTLATR